MKADANTGLLIRGKVGDLIYYVRNGKQYVRRKLIPGKQPKWETRGLTEKQKAVSVRFAVVQTFYSKYNECISPVIWRSAAQKARRTGPNLFHSLNSKCFDGEGKLVDFEHFLFSRGVLLLPRRMRLVSDGQKFRLTWEEEREWTTAFPADRLWVGVLYARHPLAPRLALDVKGVRGDFSGEFMLDSAMGTEAYIYCFFGREDETAFSDSCYFRIGDSGGQ